MKNFSEWLAKAIKEKGITQVELAKKTGVSKSSITMYIRGNVYPKRETLEKILHELGYNIDFVKQTKST